MKLNPDILKNNKEKQKEEWHLLSRSFYEFFIRLFYNELFNSVLAKSNREKQGSLYVCGGKIKDVTLNELGYIKNKLGISEKNIVYTHLEKLILYLEKSEIVDITKEKKSEFVEMLNNLKKENFQNDEEMLNTVVNTVYEFMNNNFTREELERNSLEYAKKIEEFIYLNDLLFCYKREDDPSILEFRLQGSSNFNLGELRDGFKILAQLLQNNDLRFNGVNTIRMSSKLVVDHKDVISKKYHFDILEQSNEDKIIGVQRAVMSREEFVREYIN